jgi:hypothetical protein
LASQAHGTVWKMKVACFAVKYKILSGQIHFLKYFLYHITRSKIISNKKMKMV